jgi:nitrite reductase/ring-hydroxylating ferredoxin subunit
MLQLQRPSAPNEGCASPKRDESGVSDENYRRALKLRDLQPGVPQACRMPDGESLCLVREDNDVFAFVDRCPHRDFNLSGGDMVAPGVIECPWHGAQFDCRTGAVVQGPATDELHTYPVRVVDGVVMVGPRR